MKTHVEEHELVERDYGVVGGCREKGRKGESETILYPLGPLHIQF